MNKPWTKGDPNEYKLLTPGPLTTSLGVREAMLVDRCTWDDDYKAMTQGIRSELLKIAHCDQREYAAVLMQGSGTFGVESVLSSIPSKDDTVLVLVNGAYSERMIAIMEREGVRHERLDFKWDEVPDARAVEEHLASHREVTAISMVHSETTSGILNDLKPISEVARAHGLMFIVDAMSSFGAVDIDVPGLGISFLISSANKCIQGVPGFSFVIARRSLLEASKGNARTLSLDLLDQYETMEREGGKWRFTSPTHVVAAFAQALSELEEQGGREARLNRYEQCNRALIEGMAKLGFRTYIRDHQGPIITTFFYPEGARIDFKDMHAFLKARGYVIYPGKLTRQETFRLGNIGEIGMDDVGRILEIFREYLGRLS
ncbi:MAG: 2-aminoethylphosphonate--pyruvate transaminase [Succinivibrio sp.]